MNGGLLRDCPIDKTEKESEMLLRKRAKPSVRSRYALRPRASGNLGRSKSLACFMLTSLVITLAIPIRLTAQEAQKQEREQQKREKTHHHYVLKDLGTLGGPSSFFFTNPIARFVNNRGTVVGVADTPALDPMAPNCAGPDCHLIHGFQWRQGVLTDLGTLPGGHNSAAFVVNDRGMILGFSENGLIDPVTGSPEGIGVLWKDGQIINLGTLGGGFSGGSEINHRGQIAGIAQNAIPDPFSMIGVGTETRAVLWQDGAIRDLGTLGGPDAWASWINDRGQIVGWSYTDSTPNPVTGIPTQHPFLWEDGRMRDLGTLGGTRAAVGAFAGPGGGAINNRGQVIGTSNLAGDETHHPFLWEHGVLRDLGTLGGPSGEAYWINDAGDVVGRADFSPSSTDHHAFLWRHGVMKDLGVLGVHPCSTAVAVNARGQVIGNTGICGVGGGPGFLSEDGGLMVDLNTLVRLPSSGLTIGDVAFINDRGEIAAKGQLPDGTSHDVLLIPCDLDHSDSHNCEGNSEADSDMTHSRPAQGVQGLPDETQQSAVPVSGAGSERRYPIRGHRLGADN